MNLFKRESPSLFLLLFLLLLLLLFTACIGVSKEKLLPYEAYTSSHLGFSMKYPKDWQLFETDELIKISNDTQDIILPEEDRLKEKGSFLVKLFVVEENIFSELYLVLQEASLQQKKEQSNDALMTVADMQLLTESGIDEEKKAEVEALFQELFFIDATTDVIKDDTTRGKTLSYTTFTSGFIIGETLKNEDGLITLFLVRQLDEDGTYFVVEKIIFNERLHPYDNKNGVFSPFLFIAESIELDYNNNQIINLDYNGNNN